MIGQSRICKQAANAACPLSVCITLLHILLNNKKLILRVKLCSGVQILLDVEGELLIKIRCVLVVRMLGQIIFIG